MNEREKEQLDRMRARAKRSNDRVNQDNDRVSVLLPKGTKERIKAAGYSVNGFVNQLVLEKLDELES